MPRLEYCSLVFFFFLFFFFGSIYVGSGPSLVHMFISEYATPPTCMHMLFHVYASSPKRTQICLFFAFMLF